MDDEFARLDSVRDTQIRKQLGSQFCALRLVDFCSDDASAPDVNVQVEVKIGTPNRRILQVRDVSTEYAERPRCYVLTSLMAWARWLAAFPVAVETTRRQHTPE